MFLFFLDQDVTCKIKSTPLHTLIKSNVFNKNDFLNNTDLVVKKKISEVKHQIYLSRI